MDLQEQVKAYTAWINSQLKKRSQHIIDLSQDLCDGVALAAVVEIVSGQEINALQPTNEKEKEENIVKILNFMKNSGIKLHHLSVQEITSGNVKAIMQLILALAAHFKPASIGGRKHTYMDKSYRSPVSVSKQRWRNFSDADFKSRLTEEESRLQMELNTDLSNVRALAENLQKILLEEVDNLPIKDPHPFEESMILQAKLDQSFSENQRLQNELEMLRSEVRDLKSEEAVVENRLQHHEQEILRLRQDLLKSSMEQDRLISEKAEVIVELEDALRERDRFAKKIHKKDVLIRELEHEVHFVKAEQAILISRKDKEISKLQMQINVSNSSNSSFQDNTTTRLTNSPTFTSPSNCHRHVKLNDSPKLSRRSPVSKSAQRKIRTQQKPAEAPQTMILYFTDKDMKPARTTLAKSVGDITLEDFKVAIKKEGNYRYVFKALDPELGTVKEEVFRDDDVIPGWEGKIVAWVEEEVRV